MVSKQSPGKRLLLGPIVGHTDFNSSRIWIRVDGDPDEFFLRVKGHGTFQFKSTEGQDREFGTAIALVKDLRPDWGYRYDIICRGRTVPRSKGMFRTMPAPGSMAEVLFVSISCSSMENDGAWQLLAKYIEKAKPRFLLMMGDQVYLDQGESVWEEHLYSPHKMRRRAMAEKYQQHWSREPIKTIMANIPTYMIWDDHEIRDGWGSWAGDSPTLAAKYSHGKKIAEQFEAYFEDARDVYLHFQMSHNPVNQPGVLPPEPGTNRYALPYWFQCGRLCVLVLDGRGARDVWRNSNPILGDFQWKFIRNFVDNLPAEFDGLAVVTPVPIIAMAPNSIAQNMLGERIDDIDLFKNGRTNDLLQLMKIGSNGGEMMKAFIAEYLPIVPRDISDYKLGDIDDIRDQWSHRYSQGEQAKIIKIVADSTLINRLSSQPRGVVFLGGDIHIGAIFRISVSNPLLSAQCLVASSISQDVPEYHEAFFIIGKKKFQISKESYAELQSLVRENNFGVTHFVFNRSTPLIVNSLAHAGSADYLVLGLPLWNYVGH